VILITDMLIYFIYLGCPINKDFPNYIFKNLNAVGYNYKMHDKMTSQECFEKCCQHDTCHVAYFKEKVCTRLRLVLLVTLINDLAPPLELDLLLLTNKCTLLLREFFNKHPSQINTNGSYSNVKYLNIR